MLSLLLLIFLPFLLLFVLLRFDTVAFLHFSQTEWVRHERLVSRLLLLLDSEQWIFANFGCDITGGIRILDSNKVFMRGTNL
jgi:hypothetical protein